LPPLEFGRDLVVTSAAGLQAKHIYHAAVRAHRDEHSVTVLAVICWLFPWFLGLIVAVINISIVDGKMQKKVRNMQK